MAAGTWSELKVVYRNKTSLKSGSVTSVSPAVAACHLAVKLHGLDVVRLDTYSLIPPLIAVEMCVLAIED